MSELKTIVLDGVKYVEVLDEAVVKPKFKVGDLAKVIDVCVGEWNTLVGDVVKVSEVEPNGFVNYEVLRNGKMSGMYPFRLEPYTPQAGDVLTVDGVEYRLVERKSKKDEKIIHIGDENNIFEFYESLGVDNEDSSCIEVVCKVDHEGEEVVGLAHDSYLVLEPTAVGDRTEPLELIVITELNGTKHEIESVLEVDSFVSFFENHEAIVTEEIYIPKTNISSITKAVR